MVNAEEALIRLKEGNARFLSGNLEHVVLADEAKREELIAGQKPFAIVVGCSDARVPAQVVFDQGIGELFIIRVAGNIIDLTQLGSVEFAAVNFGTPLVIVVGHSECGAIKIVLDDIENEREQESPNLKKICDHITPVVKPVVDVYSKVLTKKDLTTAAVKANIRESVRALKEDSKLLKNLIDEEKLRIVGAKYSLVTGIVDFFE